MKFCYVDESASPNDPEVQVMVGIIVDAQRLNRTKTEFSKAFDKVSEAFPEGLKELKGSRILYGKGGWRAVDATVRKDFLRSFCDWTVERKHRLALSAISTKLFEQLQEDYPAELKDIWLSGATAHCAASSTRAPVAGQQQRPYCPDIRRKQG